jgi:regulator of sigma E protease
MSWLWIFLGFSALIILHEAGHFFAAKATGMRVEKFFLFFGPKIWSVKRGETEYGIAAIPAGGYVRISGMNPDDVLPEGEEHRGYYEMPVWKRIVVIGAGPAVNIVLAFAILFAVFLTSSVGADRTIAEVFPKDPASGILRAGDRILAVDGSRYLNRSGDGRFEGFRAEVDNHRCGKGMPGEQKGGCMAGTPARFTIERHGRVMSLLVRPEYNAAAERALVGFRPGEVPIGISAGEAVDRATEKISEVSTKTVTVFANLLDPEQRKEVSGVVGTSDVAHQVIDKFGTAEALILLAVVSLSLGLINLFPFLPLDGGHIFWSLVEKVRGKRVPFSVMERAGAIGFVLVIMLFFLGLSNDIGRLTGEGFNVR